MRYLAMLLLAATVVGCSDNPTAPAQPEYEIFGIYTHGAYVLEITPFDERAVLIIPDGPSWLIGTSEVTRIGHNRIQVEEIRLHRYTKELEYVGPDRTYLFTSMDVTPTTLVEVSGWIWYKE